MKLLIFILILSSLSFANDGYIVFSKGKVFINGKSAKKGSEISYNDKVKVEKGALAVVHVEPSTKIKLKENTLITIKKPLVTKSSTSHSFLLESGQMFIKATRTKRNRYNVKTRHAVMGVRGTQFFVSTSKKDKALDWMCVNEGTVEVKVNNKKGFVLVNAGEGVAIDGKKLPKVKKYKWTKGLNWELKGDYKALKDNTDIENINYDLENVEYE